MVKTIIVAIIVYSTITFIISAICENDEVNAVLAYGPVGMVVWLLFLPWRKYRSGGFFKVEFTHRDWGTIGIAYSRSGEKPYQKIKAKEDQLKKTFGADVNALTTRVEFAEYLRGRFEQMI